MPSQFIPPELPHEAREPSARGMDVMRESAHDGDATPPAATPHGLAPPGETEDRLFTADFVFATVANFVNAFGVQMLIATMPVYVLRLGGGEADVGLVGGTVAFTALLFRPLVGWLTDVWRRRPMVPHRHVRLRAGQRGLPAGRLDLAHPFRAVRPRRRAELLHHGLQRLHRGHRAAPAAGRGHGILRGHAGTSASSPDPPSASSSSG